MNSRFFDYIDAQQYKSVICLNGKLPDDDVFIRCKNLPIIAVDGVANRLTDRNIAYDMIIGDLDSVKRELLTSSAQIVHLPSQDSSDFEKTITHLESLSLLPSIIFGINGGCLDHILHNISIFAHLDCILYSPPLIGVIIRAGKSQELYLPSMTKISFIAMPNAVISTGGLKWELDEYPLSFPGSNSCFNRNIDEKISIKVKSGQILMLIYTEDVIDGAVL